MYQHKYFRSNGWQRTIVSEIWEKNFAYLQDEGATVVLNMIGSGEKSDDASWRDTALGFVRTRGFGVFYYRLNPVRTTPPSLPPPWHPAPNMLDGFAFRVVRGARSAGQHDPSGCETVALLMAGMAQD